MNKILLRIIYSCFLLISAFVLPWWFCVVLVIMGFLFFQKLYEGIVAGIILDSIYNSKTFILDWPFLITFLLIIIFLVIGSFRKNLRF